MFVLPKLIVQLLLKELRCNTILIRNCSDTCKNYEKRKKISDPKCRILFITGGTHGIGYAIANECLFHKARGVILAGQDLCKGNEAVNTLNCSYGKSRAMFVKTDITQPGSLIDAYSAGLKQYEKIDVVVNSAGIFLGSSYGFEFKVNVIGTINSTIEACKIFKGNPGTIINICGIEGLDPSPGSPTFSACHHAIVGLSRSLGDKIVANKLNLRIITLCVGFTNTNFYQDAPKKTLNLDKCFGKILKEELEKSKKQPTDACGKAAVEVIKYAESGTVWVIEGSRLYSVNIPCWKSSSTLVNQFL